MGAKLDGAEPFWKRVPKSTNPKFFHFFIGGGQAPNETNGTNKANGDGNAHANFDYFVWYFLVMFYKMVQPHLMATLSSIITEYYHYFFWRGFGEFSATPFFEIQIERKLKRKRKQKFKQGNLREGRFAPPRRSLPLLRFCFRFRFNLRLI